MNNKKLFATAANVFFLCVLTSPLQAASITTAIIDWSTFTITADGVDVTNSVSWTDQADFIETNYIEGSTTGFSTDNFHDIDPNTGFDTTQNIHDGEIATSIDTAVSSSILSTSSSVNYTGRADANIIRFGLFTATTARYTFSVDYSLSAEVNMTNSELGGGSNTLLSSPYAELFVSNNTSGLFFFDFDDTVGINSFGVASNSGTLTAIQNFDDVFFDFTAGDEIEIDITASVSSRSLSSQAIQAAPPLATPLPATAWLLISGLLGLLGIARRQT